MSERRERPQVGVVNPAGVAFVLVLFLVPGMLAFKTAFPKLFKGSGSLWA